MLEPLILSLKVALRATLLVAVVGTAVAFALARHEFRGKGLVEAALLLPMILPPTVTGYYLVILLGRHGFIGESLFRWTGWSVMFTWQAAVVAASVVSLPIMIRTAQSAIGSVDPTMVDSSTMLGYSWTETSLHVVLPLAWPGILAGVILTFTRAIGEFGATLMLAGNIPGRTATMPLAIYGHAASGEWRQAHLLVALLTVLSVTFLLAARRVSRRVV